MSCRQHVLDAVVWSLATLYLLILVVATAEAEAPGDEALWRTECGACHVPYAPRLLPREGWRGVMASLDRHFGVRASLDPAASAAIGRYLEAQAGPPLPLTPGGDLRRITARRWFVNEHREALTSRERARTARRIAQCEACHAGAAGGQFDDDDKRRTP